jgi:molybdopterin synthase catalytic subunit
MKEIVPIWKKEHYADGAAWIGSEADYQRERGSPGAEGEPGA